jgi:hypothetical protein
MTRASLEVMDDLGIERTLMFPTLASLLDERMRDDPDLIHAVVHGLNRWLEEVWGFDHYKKMPEGFLGNPSGSGGNLARLVAA